jgi:hypothetical protein
VVAYDDENIIIGRMVEYWLDHQHDDNTTHLRAAMNGSDPITFFRFYLRVVLPYQIACYTGIADRAYNATFIIPKTDDKSNEANLLKAEIRRTKHMKELKSFFNITEDDNE